MVRLVKYLILFGFDLKGWSEVGRGVSSVPQNRARMGSELTHARHKSEADPSHGRRYRMPWALVCQLRAEYRPHVMGSGVCALAAKYRVGRQAVWSVIKYQSRVHPPKSMSWWDLQIPVARTGPGATIKK